jgi:uncharacterized protein YaaN involved in tellurite resistance
MFSRRARITEQTEEIRGVATDLGVVRELLNQIQQNLNSVDEKITDLQTAIGVSKRADGSVESDLLKSVQEINEKVTSSLATTIFLGALASLIGAISGVLLVAILQKLEILGTFFQ